MCETANGQHAAFRSGVVAVIGRPNVGKSSLLNRILKYKLSIVTAMPQTTRDNILGLYNGARSQILFVDTPGIHRPLNKLGERLVQRAVSELENADVVLYVVTIDDSPNGRENARIISTLTLLKIPIVLAVNKVDLRGSKSKILRVINSFAEKLQLADVVPVSAHDGTNCETLISVLEERLPVGVPLYPDDIITDRSERFIAQEIIREKAIIATDEEVPHSIAVEVDEYKSPDEFPQQKDLFIRATIYVEREGQRAIILGHGGEKIKSIGTAARKTIEELTGYKVFLELWVKLNRGWRDSESELKKMGYE